MIASCGLQDCPWVAPGEGRELPMVLIHESEGSVSSV